MKEDWKSLSSSNSREPPNLPSNSETPANGYLLTGVKSMTLAGPGTSRRMGVSLAGQHIASSQEPSWRNCGNQYRNAAGESTKVRSRLQMRTTSQSLISRQASNTAVSSHGWQDGLSAAQKQSLRWRLKASANFRVGKSVAVTSLRLI